MARSAAVPGVLSQELRRAVNTSSHLLPLPARFGVVRPDGDGTYTRGMQPAIRSARVLSAALVAVLVVCGVALSGASGAYAAPSRMSQHTHTVLEQHVVTAHAHAHRVTVGAPRRLDGQRHGGDSGPTARLGTAKSATSTEVVVLADARLALRVHHLAPTCARAPPV
jgi:hypothetical protein